MLFGRKAVQREEKDSEERLLTMRYHFFLQDTETIHLRQEVKKMFGCRERRRHGHIWYQWPPVLVIARGVVFVAAASDALETSGGPAGPKQRLPPICRV